MTDDSTHPRGRCFCGAWLPRGTRHGGITCQNCLEQFDVETLESNGFVWNEDESAWQYDG